MSWIFQGSAAAGVATQFSWTASPLSAGSTLAVQRQEGTGHVWRTIGTLRLASRGTGQVAALPLGRFSLRIALIGRKNTLLASQTHMLEVFGSVPFSTLFGSSSNAVVTINGDNTPGVATTPSQTFQYALSAYSQGQQPVVRVINNACQSAHFDFLPGFAPGGLGDPSALDGETATVTVVQESQAAVSASAAYDAQGSLDVKLIPGQSWALNTSGTDNPDATGPWIFFDGYAVCDSAAPFKSS